MQRQSRCKGLEVICCYYGGGDSWRSHPSEWLFYGGMLPRGGVDYCSKGGQEGMGKEVNAFFDSRLRRVWQNVGFGMLLRRVARRTTGVGMGVRLKRITIFFYVVSTGGGGA